MEISGRPYALETVAVRTRGPELPPEDAALLGAAGALLGWRAKHRFCAACGSPVKVGMCNRLLLLIEKG